MEVIFRVSDGILIASIKGEVDHHSAATLRTAIDAALTQFKCKDLIMDFSGVDFMDSSGIGVALGRYKRLIKTGGRIFISGCSEYIEKILEMAGVFSIIPVADRIDTAVDKLKGREQMRLEV